jgi:tetratricopeptide (TPR) repeat protein
MIKKLHCAHITQGVAIFTLGLVPLFFLPTTQNFYDTNKWMFLAVGALFLLLCGAVALLRVRLPLRAAVPVGAIGFMALTLASAGGLIAASTNKIEAIVSPLGPVTFCALTILVFAASAASKKGKVYLTRVLYTVISILGLNAIYQALGMGKLMFPRVAFLADPLWTPVGSVPTAIALFFITLSLLIPDILAAVKKRQDQGEIAVLCVACIVIVIGTVVTLWQFIPKIPALFPFDIGMVVASQIFKNPSATTVGVGVENFITAFTSARPASLNGTPLATVVFTTNADFFLHILTIYGLIGLAAALVLVGTLLSGNKKEWLFVTKCLCIASLLLVPPTIPLLAMVAAVLVLAHDADKQTLKSIMVPAGIRVSLGVVLLLSVPVSFYLVLRAYAAEVFFFRSLLATERNDGTKTYNLQIQAIRMNTFISRYHITYSQTSLALANSIGTSLNTPSTNTNSATDTDQDRKLIGQLVQQAVNEAKIAVSLNAANIAAWENLGLTYQSIMPVASEAAEWAISAYRSAVNLDPTNPKLFINIGGVFVNQQQYDNAIAAYNQAIRLSPSYANAYYNVANAFTLKGDTVSAVAALTEALKLVTPESTDYYKVQNELDAIQHAQTTTTEAAIPATESSELTLPQNP